MARPLSQTQLSKNMQGKQFSGHSAFKRFKEQLGKHLSAQQGREVAPRYVSDQVVKGFIKRTFGNKSETTINHFLKERLRLNESQRAVVKGVFMPTGQLTIAEKRRQDRIKASISKDQIKSAQDLAASRIARSNLHTVLAGQAAGLSTGFAGQGQRQPEKVGFAGGEKEAVGLTGEHEAGVSIAKPKAGNEPPSSPHFQA